MSQGQYAVIPWGLLPVPSCPCMGGTWAAVCWRHPVGRTAGSKASVCSASRPEPLEDWGLGLWRPDILLLRPLSLLVSPPSQPFHTPRVSLWPPCWARGRASRWQVIALPWAVRQRPRTHPARDPSHLRSSSTDEGPWAGDLRDPWVLQSDEHRLCACGCPHVGVCVCVCVVSAGGRPHPHTRGPSGAGTGSPGHSLKRVLEAPRVLLGVSTQTGWQRPPCPAPAAAQRPEEAPPAPGRVAAPRPACGPEQGWCSGAGAPSLSGAASLPGSRQALAGQLGPRAPARLPPPAAWPLGCLHPGSGRAGPCLGRHDSPTFGLWVRRGGGGGVGAALQGPGLGLLPVAWP